MARRTRYIVGRVIPVRRAGGDEEGNRQDAKSAKEEGSTEGTEGTDRERPSRQDVEGSGVADE